MIRPLGRAASAALTFTLLAGCAGPATSPTPRRTVPPPAATAWELPSLAPDEVAFATSDGLTIIGTLRGKGRIGVILGHMFGGQASDWMPLADALAEAGYAVLAINFRGNGRSEPPLQTPLLHLDIEAAARFLQARGVTDIVLVGASMGGAAVLDAANVVGAVALVAMAAPNNFGGLQLTDEKIAELSMPKLFIVSDGDLVRLQFDLVIAAAPAPKEEMRPPGNAHGTRLFEGEQRDAVIERITTFLAVNAGP